MLGITPGKGPSDPAGLAQSIVNALYGSDMWSRLRRADQELRAEPWLKMSARKVATHLGAVPLRYGCTDTNRWGHTRDPGNWVYGVALKTLALFIRRGLEVHHTSPACDGGGKPSTSPASDGAGVEVLEHPASSTNPKNRDEKCGDVIEQFLGKFMEERFPPSASLADISWDLHMADAYGKSVCRFVEYFCKCEDVTHREWTVMQGMSSEQAAQRILEQCSWEFDDIMQWCGTNKGARPRSFKGAMRQQARNNTRAAARNAARKEKGKHSGKGGDRGGASSRSWTWDATSPVGDGGKGASSSSGAAKGGASSGDWATRATPKGAHQGKADAVETVRWARATYPGSFEGDDDATVLEKVHTIEQDIEIAEVTVRDPKARWADAESDVDWDGAAPARLAQARRARRRAAHNTQRATPQSTQHSTAHTTQHTAQHTHAHDTHTHTHTHAHYRRYLAGERWSWDIARAQPPPPSPGRGVYSGSGLHRARGAQSAGRALVRRP